MRLSICEIDAERRKRAHRRRCARVLSFPMALRRPDRGSNMPQPLGVRLRRSFRPGRLVSDLKDAGRPASQLVLILAPDDQGSSRRALVRNSEQEHRRPALGCRLRTAAGGSVCSSLTIKGVHHLPRKSVTAARAGSPNRTCDFPVVMMVSTDPHLPTLLSYPIDNDRHARSQWWPSRGYATLPVTVACYQGRITQLDRRFPSCHDGQVRC